ncbi:MAG: diguanylate cyclase [Deltaproteobacteria bacterium]|nr:diguanylate cyclase [Deltaproteobacteria bacterium]
MRLATRISTVTFVSVATAAGLLATVTVRAREHVLSEEFTRSSVGVCEMLALAIASPMATESRYAEVQQILDNVSNYPERHPGIETVEVLDTDGKVVAHTDPMRFGRVRGDRQTRRDLALGEPIWRRAPSNRIQVVVPIRLAYPLGVLRATFKLDRLDETVARERILLIGGAVVGALFLSVVIFVLLRRAVSRRIEALATQVGAFRRERSARVEVGGTDEVRELGSVFNEMASELERYTVNLEHTVDERTRELKGANRRLEELAVTDGLTGLHNHRHFQERLRRDLEIARRAGRPLSVAMFDVDHFKTYNDTYGHPAGDEVLRKVASAVRREARAADLVARYGGEEFVVAMPDADRDAAQAAAERIRRHVQAEGVVTISGGIACFPEDGEDAESLIEQADRALYRAKRAGRDRIAVAWEAA